MAIRIASWSFCLLFLLGAIGMIAQTDLTKKAKESKWGLSYLNYINGPMFADPNGGSINHYLTVNREIAPDWVVSAVGRFDSNVYNGNKAYTTADHYVKVSHPSWFDFAAGKVDGSVRMYLPTSNLSKERDLRFKLNPRVYCTADVGKFNFYYVAIPVYYNYKVARQDQLTFANGHYGSMAYSLPNDFTLDFAAYPVWAYQRGGETVFNEVPVYPGVTKTFKDSNVSVSGYVEVLAAKPKNTTSSLGLSISYKMF